MPTKNTYGGVVWAAEYVKTLRPRWSLKRCEDFLVANDRHIQDRICELGWEVLEALLPNEKGG